MTAFGDTLIQRARKLGHPLCVGLDPYLDRIPSLFRRGSMQPGDPDTALAVEAFCRRIVDLIGADAVIVKPQASLFERLGWQGWRALERVIAHARASGVPVLLDAKRGDIADTATAYAQAYLAKDSPCPVDALTVNAYLGPESLTPFMLEAEKTGRGLVVLVRNSNIDSSAYQSLQTSDGPHFKVVAASLAAWQSRLSGGETGWSSLGVTVAATHAADSELIRMALPTAWFLVLGYGAQGASARDAVRGFRRGPSGLEGGVVSSSRPILFPELSDDASAAVWERAIRAAVSKAADELRRVVA